MTAFELLMMFVGGLLGSAHCIGMCGGFVVTIGATAKGTRELIQRQLIYTAGRIFTYAFLGAIVGFVGLRASGYSGWSWAQRGFSILAGGLMIFIGAGVLWGRPIANWTRSKPLLIGPVPNSKRQESSPVLPKPNQCFSAACRIMGNQDEARSNMPDIRLPVSFSSCSSFSGSSRRSPAFDLFRGFFRLPGMLGAGIAGLATGFLPCGLVYAFLAEAGSHGTVGRSMISMACFGAGTAPLMIAAGCGGSLIPRSWRPRLYRLAAVSVITLGGLTLWRGTIAPRPHACCQAESTQQ